MQVYDVTDATNPEPIQDAGVFLNGMIDDVAAGGRFSHFRRSTHKSCAPRSNKQGLVIVFQVRVWKPQW